MAETSDPRIRREAHAGARAGRRSPAAVQLDPRLVLVTPETDLDAPGRGAPVAARPTAGRQARPALRQARQEQPPLPRTPIRRGEGLDRRADEQGSDDRPDDRQDDGHAHALPDRAVRARTSGEYYLAITTAPRARHDLLLDPGRDRHRGGLGLRRRRSTCRSSTTPRTCASRSSCRRSRRPGDGRRRSSRSCTASSPTTTSPTSSSTRSRSRRTGQVVPLDCVRKLDDTAAFQCAEKWGTLEFPKAFGTTDDEGRGVREVARREDRRLAQADRPQPARAASGTWSPAAGRASSTPTPSSTSGFAKELANYGEYSGDPSTEETYEYTKTVLDLMTREPDPQGRPKFLLIGGGIANFTDVAKTFTGIIQALEEYKDRLQEEQGQDLRAPRRPELQEGLAKMRRARARGSACPSRSTARRRT